MKLELAMLVINFVMLIIIIQLSLGQMPLSDCRQLPLPYK